jgi:DNA-binding transcriptional ArsR family regulator
MSQPAVSKHLGVLRKVGLVSVSKQGQQRLYQLEAGPRPSHQASHSPGNHRVDADVASSNQTFDGAVAGK